MVNRVIWIKVDLLEIRVVECKVTIIASQKEASIILITDKIRKEIWEAIMDSRGTMANSALTTSLEEEILTRTINFRIRTFAIDVSSQVIISVTAQRMEMPTSIRVRTEVCRNSTFGRCSWSWMTQSSNVMQEMWLNLFLSRMKSIPWKKTKLSQTLENKLERMLPNRKLRKRIFAHPR